jgi:hypothetical protein
MQRRPGRNEMPSEGDYLTVMRENLRRLSEAL